MGGRVAEGLKERRSIRERVKEPLALGLLEDQDHYCYYHCLIFPPPLPPPSFSIHLSLFFPSQIVRLVSRLFLSYLASLPLSFCLLSLHTGPHSEDRLLAGRCCRGGKASKSLMRCLSPQSRLDRSSQQRITTTPHCTVLHTVPCLPATAAAEGVARGKVCVCAARTE